MRDMRPDHDDPNFQQVRLDVPEEDSSGGLRAAGALALFVAPFLTVACLLVFWPDDEPVTEDPALAASSEGAPAAEVDPVAALEAAQARVASLQGEIDARKAELDQLRDARDEDLVRSDTRRADLEREVARLRTRLGDAQAQRDDLSGRLRVALADLDREIGANVETRRQVVALEAANTDNLWVAFTQSVKIEVCGQITERLRERCRERVDGWFDEGRQDRFASCVTEHETIPSLWRREGGALPDYGEPLDLGPGRRQGWYVQFCNPTLPEAVVADAGAAGAPVFIASAR